MQLDMLNYFVLLKKHCRIEYEQRSNTAIAMEEVKMQDYIAAHKFSLYHRKELWNDHKCGCFCCLAIFNPNEIDDWIDNNDTAICPYCGIDSIIGEYTGYPITKEFLKQMNEFWF